MSWKPTTLANVSRVSDFESKWVQCSEGEFFYIIMTDNMDLDNHLLASTMYHVVLSVISKEPATS